MQFFKRETYVVCSNEVPYGCFDNKHVLSYILGNMIFSSSQNICCGCFVVTETSRNEKPRLFDAVSSKSGRIMRLWASQVVIIQSPSSHVLLNIPTEHHVTVTCHMPLKNSPKTQTQIPKITIMNSFSQLTLSPLVWKSNCDPPPPHPPL